MLSPLRKSSEKGQKRANAELPLPPKEKELIARLASEQEKPLEKKPSKYRGRRRLSSVEGANTMMMMSMVPSPIPPSPTSPNEPDIGGRPALSITKQFQRQIEQTRRASIIQTRAMSLEGVTKVKAEPQYSGRKKSGERSSLKDRGEIKSSRSSKSLSPRSIARPGNEIPLVNVEMIPTPPPPTPRSPVAPQVQEMKATAEDTHLKPSSPPQTQPVNVAPPTTALSPPSSGEGESARTSTGTSSGRKKFTFFMPKKTQTDEDTNKGGRVSSSVRLGEALGIKFAKLKEPKKVKKKLKDYVQSVKTLERLKGAQRREAEELNKLSEMGIPEQNKLMESLLEHDHYKHNFNGFLRQYYSFVLRCHCLMNMQGRYRGMGDQAECFKLIDISKLRTKSEEILRRQEHQQARREIELNKLRHVARDSLHYRFLKEMWENQVMTLPITIMHSILAEVTPVVEGIWRQYVAHLGRLHQTSNQCGAHFIRLQQRHEMYEQLGLGDNYEDTEET